MKLNVTFGKAESYTQGWKGKTTTVEVRIDEVRGGRTSKVVIGDVVGRENAGMAGVMMWRVELHDGRNANVDSMKAGKEKAREMAEQWAVWFGDAP